MYVYVYMYIYIYTLFVTSYTTQHARKDVHGRNADGVPHRRLYAGPDPSAPGEAITLYVCMYIYIYMYIHNIHIYIYI